MTNPKNVLTSSKHGRRINADIGKRRYSARSLHGLVVHELGLRIVSGQIAEGAVLPIETELGTEFDVSRTALREGIKVLTAKGLLVSRTRTGTRVRPRSDWNMLDPDVLAWRLESRHDAEFAQDLYDFRMAIEPMAASLAADRATDEQISEMEAALSDMRKAGTDSQAFIEPDLRFHQTLLKACHNDLLASLSALIETALSFSFNQAELDVSDTMADVHAVVFEAIRDHDPQAAQVAMVALLNCSRDLNKAVLQKISDESA